MSVANRYKSLTLSGTECFAMLRAMAGREAHLVAQIQVSELHREADQNTYYLTTQLEDLRKVSAKFRTTPFIDGGL